MKRQAIDWEEIFAKCVSHMGLVNNNSWVNNAGKKQNKTKKQQFTTEGDTTLAYYSECL